jgi:hypothetical protein
MLLWSPAFGSLQKLLSTFQAMKRRVDLQTFSQLS